MKLESLEKWLQAHGYTYKRQQAGSAYFKSVAPIRCDYIEVLFDFSEYSAGQPALDKYLKRYQFKYSWHTYGNGVYYNIFTPADFDALDLYFFYQNKAHDLWEQLAHKYRQYDLSHPAHFNHRITQIMEIYGRRYLAAAGRCY